MDNKIISLREEGSKLQKQSSQLRKETTVMIGYLHPPNTYRSSQY